MKNKKFTIILATCSVLILALVGASIALLMGGKEEAPAPTQSRLHVAESKKPVETQKPKETQEEPKVILPSLKEKVEQNPDMVGWIKLPNSRVDYPVMYTPDDMEYYLHRNFEKQNDIYGLPFMDTRCSLDGDNFLIYGHETDNGSQFHDFLQYQNQSFWEKNKYIIYSDLYHTYEYEVVAFCLSRVYNRDDKVFKYYQYFGSNGDKQAFDNYISNIKKIELYKTGVTAEFGDHLITLSMCVTPYQDPNDGRYVLVAKRGKQLD